MLPAAKFDPLGVVRLHLFENPLDHAKLLCFVFADTRRNDEEKSEDTSN